jgi:hypothetical protein
VAVAGAAAGAKADADAKAAAVSVSNAEGGNAKSASVATGGDASATGGNAAAEGGKAFAAGGKDGHGGEGGSSASDASSNSGGNSLTVNEQQVRQAPGMAQGSFAIVGCGVAANAGGSNVNGSAFLGFGFTPQQCYDFMLANAYCSAGATQACCEVLNASKAGRRAAKRGVVLPECRPVVHEPTPPPPVQPPVIVQVPCCDKPEPEPCPPDNRCYEKCEKACKAQCQGNAECEARCERLCKRRCDGEPPSPPGTAPQSCPAPVEQSKAN